MTILPQITHFSLFSCSAMCVCRSISFCSSWWHRSQRKMWRPVSGIINRPVGCDLMCRDNMPADFSILPQMWQIWSLVSARECAASQCTCSNISLLNFSPHLSHWCWLWQVRKVIGNTEKILYIIMHADWMMDDINTCNFICEIRLALNLVTLSQCEHLNMLPCNTIWACISAAFCSTWPHRSHRNEVCPVSDRIIFAVWCVAACCDRLWADFNFFPQILHSYSFVSTIISWELSSPVCKINRSPEKLPTNNQLIVWYIHEVACAEWG